MAIAYQYTTKSPLFIPFVFLILLHPHPHATTFAINDADALLEFKNSLGNPENLNSWVPNTTPCQDKNARWNGVVCYEGIVIGIHLKSMGLSGNINVEALLSLPGLRSISLEGNKFVGPMPEFNRLGALKAIYLSNNQFSGQIPSGYFMKMESLKKLWLANNEFSGDIPSSLVDLRYLLELHLENNQFSGMIPSLRQPPLLSLDLSNNQLQGEIPTSLSSFNASSFEGNANLCGAIIGRDCNQVVTPTTTTTSKESQGGGNGDSNTKVVATGVTVSLVVVSLLVIVICVSKKRKDENIPTMITLSPIPTPAPTESPAVATSTASTTTTASLGSGKKNVDEGVVEVEVGPTMNRKDSSNSSSRRSTSSRKGSGTGGGPSAIADLTMVNDEKGAFGLADLMKASAEVLGNGGMGSAYKAIMSNGLAVAVKRMRELNRLEKDAFEGEIRKLASLRHENVLPPLAYHYRKEEKLVVYEHVAKGSLHCLLHGDRGLSHAELNWATRLNIIKGITQGLHYLHTQLDTYDLPHGNLKSSNILIDLSNTPLLSDYGFNTMTNPNVATHALFGYRAPEAVQRLVISPKCDIYCLGVVILEIMTGKFPSQYVANTKSGTDVVQWAVSAIGEGRESGLLDPDMLVSGSSSCTDDMVEVLHIGVACTEPNPDLRPCLDEVIERLERVQAMGYDSRTFQVLPSLRDGIS